MRLILCFLFVLLCQTTKAQYFDTVHLYYDIGVAQLSPQHKNTLDFLFKNIGERKLLIYSYADYLGNEKPNYQLSNKRAAEIKTLLLAKGIPETQIMECSGLGQITNAKEGKTSSGEQQNRRSDIFIRKEKAETNSISKTNASKPTKQERNPFGDAIEVIGAPDDDTPPAITKIDINTIKENDVINLKNIEFMPGSTRILTRSYPELDNLYNFMADNPKVKIRLEGHVCCCIYPDGFFDDTPTWALSVYRAKTIQQHLITRGIDAKRLQYQGFGRTKPIRDNEKTSEEGQVNRRVEVRILEK